MNFSVLLAYFSAAAAALLAIGLLFRSPRTLADLALALSMGVLAFEGYCNARTFAATSPGALASWQHYRLLALAALPGLWLLFSLTYARGNTRKIAGHSQTLIYAAFLLPLFLAVLFRKSLIVAVGAAEGHARMAELSSIGLVLYFFLLLGCIATLMNLERTFRASVGTQRWRIKFMLLGMGSVLVARLYTSTQTLLVRRVDLPLEIINAGALIVAVVLILRSLLRTGKFEMDVYPSQSVIQGSVTVMLTGAYLLIVGVFARIAAYVGGESAFALKTFVILLSLVGLTILLQSDRVKLRLRQLVSRHFQRPIYDYRTMWQRFNHATASRVDQGDLCRSLVRLIADSFQALSVTIWLLDDQGALTMVASTSLSEAAPSDAARRQAESQVLLTFLQNHPEPVDFDFTSGEWATALREWHPRIFPHGGNRVCTPLMKGGEVLGLITLGDRVGGTAFSLQDFDMLKCVADHAATSVLSVRLSQKLFQTKQLEAFQTMAAFFVHDLKNAASTLSLMLQNLPVHFDDPEFRADTLRGIAKTVEHINRLIGRLSMLRHELKIQLAETDLNQIVTTALADLDKNPALTVVKNLPALPRIALDRDQILKVITNLVINAREALPPQGRLTVTTSDLNEWLVITVTDNGAGMSPEFLQRSLFRPFQTTKKTGLGIGMFQSKMIVEAHRGKIMVASEPGQGTTFQVFLPKTAAVE